MDYEDSDPSYNPSIYSYEATDAETTPSQRIVDGKNMSQAAKTRVDKVAEKRCLIECMSEHNHVDYAHCLPRSTKGPLLDKLEFAWGMGRFTLNVDTRYNVIRCSRFHKSFDAKKWLLLPETQVIDAFYKTKDTRQTPQFNDPIYNYVLIPSQDMWDVPIHRQKLPPPPAPMPPPSEDYEHFPYPYLGFPVITSHIKPHFVICNSGFKLDADLPKWVRDSGAYIGELAKVHAIWRAWNKAIPQGEFIQKISDGDDPDIADSDTNKTAPCRIIRSTRPKRKTTDNHNSPTPKSSKQRTLVNGGTWLDDGTLHEFNQQTSSHSDRVIEKKQWILDWLRGLLSSRSAADLNTKVNSESNPHSAVADVNANPAHMAYD